MKLIVYFFGGLVALVALIPAMLALGCLLVACKFPKAPKFPSLPKLAHSNISEGKITESKRTRATPLSRHS